MPTIVDLTILIDNVRLTTALNPSGQSFVMSGEDISIIETPGVAWPQGIANLSNNLLTLSPPTGVMSEDVTLSFHVQDARQAIGTYTYSIRGIVEKREIDGATRAPQPTRFANIRWAANDPYLLNLLVDFKLESGGMAFEYYLLIQNNASGEFGLVDPPLVTNG